MHLQDIFGTVAFCCLFLIPAAGEAENYITCAALIVIMVLSVYLALKEDGQIKK